MEPEVIYNKLNALLSNLDRSEFAAAQVDWDILECCNVQLLQNVYPIRGKTVVNCVVAGVSKNYYGFCYKVEQLFFREYKYKIEIKLI